MDWRLRCLLTIFEPSDIGIAICPRLQTCIDKFFIVPGVALQDDHQRSRVRTDWRTSLFLDLRAIRTWNYDLPTPMDPYQWGLHSDESISIRWSPRVRYLVSLPVSLISWSFKVEIVIRLFLRTCINLRKHSMSFSSFFFHLYEW